MLPILRCTIYLLSGQSDLQRYCRDGGPTVFAVVKHGKAVDDIVELILRAWKSSGAYEVSLERWKHDKKKGSGIVEK